MELPESPNYKTLDVHFVADQSEYLVFGDEQHHPQTSMSSLPLYADGYPSTYSMQSETSEFYSDNKEY